MTVNVPIRCAHCGDVTDVAVAVPAAIRAAVATEISRAILEHRANGIGDGHTADARGLEQAAAIARIVGGCDPLDEFAPQEPRHGGQERRTGPSAGHPHPRRGQRGAEGR